MINESYELVTMPMLALRGLVVFPEMRIHFDVGRKKSIAALQEAMERDRKVFLLTQKDMREEDPSEDQLYVTGCVAKIRQLVKIAPDTVRVMVEGISRAEYLTINTYEPYYIATVHLLEDKKPRVSASYSEALIRRVREGFETYAALSPKLSPDIGISVLEIEEPGRLADFIASNTPLPVDDRQYVLETLDPVARLRVVAQILGREAEILRLDARIGEKVKEQMNDNQREYYLREQMKAISSELYGDDDPDEEYNSYREKIFSLNAPDDIKERLLKEVDKLYKMPSGSHEATVVRGYLDVCIGLPWGVYTTDKIDVRRSEKILDRDHYGMEKVKQRVIEMLAVRKIAPDIKGQIICLVGPPGVGKTSVAKAVAECMGRKFQRIALGGVHDEAEIRGHRKTYIGSMPGRIIDAVSKAGSSNPVILLDEIDKMASDMRGDPSSALLEVLDAEQNSAFCDHFVELPFDLSKVLFLTTANTAESIPGPLYDRMEVINLSSYTANEKFNIAKKHLVKKQLKRHGLLASELRFADSGINAIIEGYTREGGVRQLEREIAAVCRKVAKLKAADELKKITITDKNLKEYLGTPKFKDDSLMKKDTVGIVNGLAYTSVGGELLQLEAAVVEGTGKLVLTGSLGDVMKESASTAVSFIRANADRLQIDPSFYKNKDIHIHATQAAVPKDGPSAGVTIVTAVVSALKNLPVKRDIAMTGEVTLLGRALPIGGLKEKTMAAYRAGVKTVFIPADNVADLDDIDATVRNALKFVPVQNVLEILDVCYSPNEESVAAEQIYLPNKEKVVRNELQ